MENKGGVTSFLCCLNLTVLCSLLTAQTFPVSNIVKTGENDKRINIVFMGDGYLNSELAQYNQNIINVIGDLFNTTPYQEYESFFNVYSIDVPSNESGTDHPGTASDEPQGETDIFTKDTYFNCTFDFYGIHRLLVPDFTLSQNVLANNFPMWDIAFMIVNHNWYGGSGGSPATFSLNTSSSEIAIHELGHSFGQLADEYGYGNEAGYEAPNATAVTDRNSIKWNNWIDGSTPIPTPEQSAYSTVVGLFEGAVYNPTGWFRPKLDCKMKTLNVPFCEVCIEHTIIEIYNLVNTIDSYAPAETEVTVPVNSTQDFSITRKTPNPNTLKTEWYLNDQSIGFEGSTYTFNPSLLKRSTYTNYPSQFIDNSHTLKVVVSDTTQMVKSDPNNLLTSSITWNITIDSTAVSELDGSQAPNKFMLHQNFPNPFNPSTTIHYSLPENVDVIITIYDMLGRNVYQFPSQKQSLGDHSIQWNGFDSQGNPVSAGIYFYQIQANGFVQTKKMLLLR